LLFKTTQLLFKTTQLLFKTTRSSNEEPLLLDTMKVSSRKIALLLETTAPSSISEPLPARRTPRGKGNEPRREHSDTHFVIPYDHDEYPTPHCVDPTGRLAIAVAETPRQRTTGASPQPPAAQRKRAPS
jgi:hypothetical protein